ncbi:MULTISPECIES: GNAT family N-acetyltransferase [Streptomyces]|uniref:GNAT family N-acetyltransferase n=1 Tax=Streptomyces TaxID=1883 RepID=UPI001E54FDF8|nr:MULTISPECIES: GNAT family N-acetyltransferase [Streptomyces]UFQ16479.1 GNAT family N-acetyltransferase [Streptomyces huasconensis]WCL86081.1 GNAT family N-acetyltransferase [Streptomyces sp. JCM 35825]
MLLMGGDRVEEAVAHAARVLRAAAGRDWGVAAGGLDWSCLQTAEHIAGDLVAYAGQLTGRATGAYVPFGITLDEGTDPEGAIRVIEATGGILASVVRTTPPGVRAYHPYPHGSADAAGFAAMGVAEVLLHTYDIARALGVDAEPPEELCAAVLGHLFPHVSPAGGPPWRVLLWATGRGDLPGRAPLTRWRWHNSLSLPAGPVSLSEVSPTAAADLAAGGTGGLTWIEGGPFPGTRGAAGRVAKAYADGTHRPEWGLYALVRAEDGLAVGGMGFHGPPDEEGCLEVGYDLAEAARGHGHATAALRALSEWALARPGVTSLLALVDPENTASQGVLTRAGYARLADRDATWAYGMRRA